MSVAQLTGDDEVLERARVLADCTDRREFVDEARLLLERAIGADTSMWFPWDHGEQHFSGAIWPSVAADVRLAYSNGLFRDDPIYRWIEENPAAPTICVTTLQDLSERGCVLTKAWRERCYHPCSIGDIICIAHVRNGRIVGNFSLHRAARARPFGPRAVRSARLFSHLLGAVYNRLADSPPLEHRSGTFDAQFDLLTPREQTIATLASEGLGSKEIAKRAGSSRKTVDNQLSSIYAKLGVSGRAALAKRYWQHRSRARHS